MGQSSEYRTGPGAVPVEITLARDLASMHKKLTGVAASVSIIGILSGLCLGGWIAHTVGVGLRPLQAIAARASSMEVDRLGEGFRQSGLPIELTPIVERLNQLLARIAQSLDREKQFSADLAHEIRTPLAELRMNAGSALKWPEDSGPDDWKAVLNSVDRMENITNAMLLLARIERHPADPGDQAVSLKPIVEECLNSRSSNAHQRELRLINSLPEEAHLPGIPELWQSMIDNIIGNAVEYADAGTEITVSWSFTPPALHIDNAASNLDPEDAGHLFDRFWRKDRARTAAKHSGLGLAIAKACADAMGLAISARITSLPPDQTTHLTFSIQSITPFRGDSE
jgi:two-component system sensor histidine kinase QseC